MSKRLYLALDGFYGDGSRDVVWKGEGRRAPPNLLFPPPPPVKVCIIDRAIFLHYSLDNSKSRSD